MGKVNRNMAPIDFNISILMLPAPQVHLACNTKVQRLPTYKYAMDNMEKPRGQSSSPVLKMAFSR